MNALKSGKSKIEISQPLRESLIGSDDIRISRLPTVIDSLNYLAAQLPERYHWRFKTSEAFQEEKAKLLIQNAAIVDKNALYWRDTLANIEAYFVTAIWRMVDICQAAIYAVESENIVPAGILARSALESAVQFVHDARKICSTLDDVSKVDFSKNICESSELECFILKTTFSTRLTGSEEFYKSTNIITVKDRIAKIAKNDQIRDNYEILSELTHPSFLGRSIYLVDRKKGPRDGDEIRIAAHENGLNSESILQVVLWALSWAIDAQAVSGHLLQETIGGMFKTFPFLDTSHTRRSVGNRPLH